METTPNRTQTAHGWAAMDSSTGKVEPFVFKRRATGPDDVTIKILYCGMCHSDLHFIKNDWDITHYPVVPGHEITGLITEAGANAAADGFKPGDRVGVGCLVASCLACDACKAGEENYCDKLLSTYNGVLWDGSVTYGGYSDIIVVDRRFVVRIPEGLPLDAAAPLLCAGITVYSPMRRYGMVQQGEGKTLGVVGLGGLGHVAVKFGKKFGMRVTVISTSPAKKDEAIRRLGADEFLISTDDEQMVLGNGTAENTADSRRAINHTKANTGFTWFGQCDLHPREEEKIYPLLTRGVQEEKLKNSPNTETQYTQEKSRERRPPRRQKEEVRYPTLENG